MSSQGKSSKYRGVTLFRPTGKWRAQISAGGKTLSLGDHDSETEAARAWDRAVVHKSGHAARTNFPITDYEDEIGQLQAMSHQELVALLRSRARRSGAQTSHFRGVSLLKQTGRWHAQINAGGRQVHLGFFGTEEEAARAYDRAAITKGSGEGSAAGGARIITNFDLADYAPELGVLQCISQEELIAALASESMRKAAMDLLAGGFTAEAASAVFGRPLEPAAPPQEVLDELMGRAERALPKPPLALGQHPPSQAASQAASQASQPQQQQQQPQEEGQQEQGQQAAAAAAAGEGNSAAGPSGRQLVQQAQAATPPKPPTRSPLPPRTPLAPPPITPLPTALSGNAVAMAAAAAAVGAAGPFVNSPPPRTDRPMRRTASASALGAISAAARALGSKRSLSYMDEGAGDSGAAAPEVASPPPKQQRQQREREESAAQQGGRKRRKVAQPARAADA